MGRTAMELHGVVKMTADIDGHLMLVKLHPCGADQNTVARTLAALAGTIQALEDGSWAARNLTATPKMTSNEDAASLATS